MKKIFLTTILAVAAMNINAQLVVDSLGRVGIATDSVKSIFSVGTFGDENSAIFCNAHGKTRGMHISNYTNSDDSTYGTHSYVTNLIGNAYGARYFARGSGNITLSQIAVGMSGLANGARTSIGIFGGKSGTFSPVNYAGVYGSESSSLPSFTNYSGKYAGYFYGKVRVTNGIYATVLSPSASPSPSGQGGTTVLSDRGENVTDKLSQVQAVQFLRYDPTKETKTAKTNLDDMDIDNMSQEELDSLAETIDEEPEPYLSPIQYGLAADQLKAVYPELVYEDANGNVSINYVEMIPLLVQSINELSQKLAALEGTSAKKSKSKSQPTAIEETVSDIDMVRMDQNKPNPFSESTVISLNIPDKAQTASIFIYDMSGKQVQNIAVSERGETNITVYASDLSAGMYIYTLVVDGKAAVTRRMIVSKN